jgi:hypothetical protein
LLEVVDFGNQKKYESQIFPPTHPWFWHAVCEARPTEGDGPDAGGSAFFDRTKNDGMFQKMHPCLSKTAQSPQVVGTAGKTAFFFGTFFWANKRKYRCRAKVTGPGGREQTCSNSFWLNPPREASKWRFFYGHLPRGVVIRLTHG